MPEQTPTREIFMNLDGESLDGVVELLLLFAARRQNLLEVIDLPVVVKAATEDLRDSAVRLDEILEPYWSDVGR